MDSKRAVFLLLLWTLMLFICGLMIFTRGFLLSRSVIDIYSTCNGAASRSDLNNSDVESCRNGLKTHYKRVALVIIDGLRFDFLNYDNSIGDKPLAFQNKFIKTWQLLRQHPHRGQVFKVIADPPTTSLQRVKGIATGSLPTFIDAGANFESTKIFEDNFVLQLHKHNRTVLFMGSDVWYDAFSDSMTLAYPQSAANVMDFDSCDHAIEERLVPQLKTGRWDAVIAHYLGVDHCGHRHGPYHPEMTRKLKQMDDDVSELMETIDNDTLLIVMGDHGMTSSGDHGGDSDSEIVAGMLIYSKREMFYSLSSIATHYQIDLVPTISLLLDIPIPYSNLGIILPSLFNLPVVDPDAHANHLVQHVRNSWNHLNALHQNGKQIMAYINAYRAASGDLDEALLEKALQHYNGLLRRYDTLSHNVKEFMQHRKGSATDIDTHIQKLYSDFENHLQVVRGICAEKWAKFDTTAMGLGMVIMVGTILACVVLSLFTSHHMAISVHGIMLGVVSTCCGFLSVSGLFFSHSNGTLVASVWGIISLLLLTKLVVGKSSSTRAFPWENLLSLNVIFEAFVDNGLLVVSLGFLGIYFCAFFSNSYVVNEGAILFFLLNSAALFMTFQNLFKTTESKKTFKISSRLRQSTHGSASNDVSWNVIFAFGIFILLNYAQRGYFKCREEQKECLELVEQVSASQKDTKSFQVILFATVTLLLSYTTYNLLKRNGHLSFYNPSSLYVILLCPLSLLCMFLHWTFDIASDKSIAVVMEFSIVGEVFLPVAVYIISIIGLWSISWKPINAIAARQRDHDRNWTMGEDDDIRIKSIYTHLSMSWSSHSKDDEPPMVFGLGYCYSIAFGMLVICLGTTAATVLGADQSPSILFLGICAGALLYGLKGTENRVSLIILWSFLASYGFFATGHQAALSAIPFDAAFVGTRGNYTILIPIRALLVIFNAFCGHIMMALAVPLLYIWSSVSHKSSGKEVVYLGSSTQTTEMQHEVDIATDFTKSIHGCFQSILFYAVIRMVKVLATVCSTSLHRRHLMVWKIFAPRFVFESISFLITAITLVLAQLFFVRVTRLLKEWIAGLEKTKPHQR